MILDFNPPMNLHYSEISLINESWFEMLARRKRELQVSQSGEASHRLVAVFGGAEFRPTDRAFLNAFKVGRAVAELGGTIITGGYAGVMEGASAGAREAGGRVVGVTCNNLPEDLPNQYITDEWRVPRWDQRLVALVWLSDGYVIMPGSSGTLVELAMVIETQNKGFIPRRPVVCFGGHWRSIVRRIDGLDGIIQFARDGKSCAAIAMGFR